MNESFLEVLAAAWKLTSLPLLQVLVVTTHKGAPEEFHGAKVIGSWR
jgi:hypothetical protein